MGNNEQITISIIGDKLGLITKIMADKELKELFTKKLRPFRAELSELLEREHIEISTINQIADIIAKNRLHEYAAMRDGYEQRSIDELINKAVALKLKEFVTIDLMWRKTPDDYPEYCAKRVMKAIRKLIAKHYIERQAIDVVLDDGWLFILLSYEKIKEIIRLNELIMEQVIL